VVTHISEILDDVCAVFGPKFESAHIRVEHQYQIEGKVTIFPSELRQVFTNLVSNAIDAMPKGGELRLAIENSQAGEAVVTIGDSGCGIPIENINAIYKPFFTTKGENGSGIGLWVVKGIVDKVGGRIEVMSSTTGKTGTCFTLSFPATKGSAAINREDVGDPGNVCDRKLA
jgi:signal transduction histidine kinase